ncbi:Hypothetical protein CAP_2579 [Chondromyces apiculatus DSM 436]|uniref:Uncharacterized protein n=1 Tax=Chondromyces apiculatus DSM 436 TaxID=1192034 RepID=A0A017THG4_9BACT|nr:Hypothetical protein CAP_2579 [Chondromyces apiculatus DSM 436]
MTRGRVGERSGLRVSMHSRTTRSIHGTTRHWLRSRAHTL